MASSSEDCDCCPCCCMCGYEVYEGPITLEEHERRESAAVKYLGANLLNRTMLRLTSASILERIELGN